MTVKQEVLDIIKDEIDSIEHNFPFTHDDEVKINILKELYNTINEVIKEWYSVVEENK